MKSIFTSCMLLTFLILGAATISFAHGVNDNSCPVATISYTGSPYCSNAGKATVTFTGTRGGTYSSTAGLNIDPEYGFIDLASSIPGNYTVTYTIAGAESCSDFSTTTDITITPAPSASIDYAGSPFCNGAGTVSVNLNGTPGGVFTSSNGLAIDAVSGDIDLGSSLPNTYTVSYSLKAGGCALTAITSVTIAAQPNAAISYPASPYCKTAGIAGVNLNGTGGGTFSSSAGLAIDAGTGDINLAASSPGNYTVTYYIPASTSCGDFTTTAGLTIIAASTANFSYPNSPYCTLLDTAMVSFSGTNGGIFSSDPGLTIDSMTGTVTIQSSTPGTYIVYYTLAPSPCGMLSNLAYITIDNSVCRPVVKKHFSTELLKANRQDNVTSKLNLGSELGAVTIYPNPVSGRTINLLFNKMSEGIYNVKLINPYGAPVQYDRIVYKGGNGTRQIQVRSSMTKGYYRLEIINPAGIISTQTVVVAE